MQKLQAILISVLIIVALFTSIYFPYKWKQLSNDFLNQTNQYGELLKQINDLQKEVMELRGGEREVEEFGDWKTYRNEEYGFEMKYPEKLLLDNELRTGAIHISEIRDSEGKYYKGVYLGEFEFGCSLGIYKTDNNLLSYLENDKSYFTNQIIEIEDNIYYLGLSMASHAVDTQDCLPVFNKMVSSFQIIEDSNETTNWQDYRNEKYEFEIKYPKEAKYSKPKAQGIVFVGEIPISGYGYGVTIDVIENPQNLSAEKWYSQYYKSKKEESKDFPFFLSPKGEHTKLNIYSAYKTIDSGIDHTDIYYFISRNNYIYKVYYNEEKANDPNWNQHEEIINQILSTFKFIE